MSRDSEAAPPAAAARRAGAALPPAASDRRAEVSLGWLIRLRWGAVLGQSATIAVARVFLHAPLPLERLLTLVLVLLASNLLLTAAGRRAAPGTLCGAALAFDTLQLTGLLHATGGAANPFSVLYLVYITLAAVVLAARWTWFLAALSIGCYGLLFMTEWPLEHVGHGGAAMQLHLQGMWVAFCVAAVLTALFVVQMSTAIEKRDAEMAAMRDRTARSERLASLTTLAAGAAHELGSPLATIAVAARELERSILSLPGGQSAALLEDAALIRSELDRCRAILDRMAADVGQTPGEAAIELSAPELLTEVVGTLPAAHRARVTTSTLGAARVCAPRRALVQVAANLLRNALDAGGDTVTFGVEVGPAGLLVRVHDNGPGMPPEVLARVGEPFFSTKAPGTGLGLGVFIARSLCEQMGGRLTLESGPGRGTTAQAEIPGVPVLERGAP
jgi:two-component system sensor histidine kinase RegB